MIFYQNYRKEYVNPYRTGVKIGNYNEDLYGQELKEKYEKEKVNPKMYMSETMDKFRWPRLRPRDIHHPGNELTMTQNSNFDLNIEVSKVNVQDYLKLQEKNAPYILKDKNKFLVEQLKEEQQLKALENSEKNQNIEENSFPQNEINNPPKSKEEQLSNEMQKLLCKYHIKDTNGLLYTRNQGLSPNLLFGHGDQRNFNKTEYATTYQLTMSQKEKTDTIYNPKYKVNKTYMRPMSAQFDRSDWPYRKYKIYDDFTKTFDKTTTLTKNC